MLVVNKKFGLFLSGPSTRDVTEPNFEGHGGSPSRALFSPFFGGGLPLLN